MNWDAISAVSEIVAAAAVVVSVVYLAAQVRSSNETFRVGLRESLFHSTLEWNAHIAGDPELPWLFQRAVRDLEGLNEKERARAIHVLYSFFKTHENQYLHYLEGSVEEKVWRRSSQILRAYGTQPGAQAYLKVRIDAFTDEFQEVLQSLNSAEIPPAHEAFKFEGVKAAEQSSSQ